IFSLIKELFIHILHCLFPKVFLHKEGRPVKPEYIEMQWYYLSLNWMYVLSDAKKFARSILRMINLAESKIGRSKELGLCTAGYGCIYMILSLFKRSIRYHEKAIKMREELNDEWGIAQSLQFMGFCYLWKGDYQKSIEYFQQSKDKFQKMGDMWELGMVINGLGFDHFYKGNYHEALNYFFQYLETSQKIRDDYGFISAEENISRVYAKKGEFDKAEELLKETSAVTEEKKLWFTNCTSYSEWGYLDIEGGKCDEAIKHLKMAKKLNEEYTFPKDYIVYLYPHLAEAYIGQFTAHSSQFTAREKKQKLKKIRTACKEALKQTKSWVNHYGSALRVNGKYYALAGKIKKAEGFFLRSIEQTRSLGRRYELARSYYEYGQFLKDQGEEEKAKDNWQQAYNLFEEIGAQVYIKRTADLLGIALEKEKEAIEEPETAQERLRVEQELMSLIKVSQYLSSILKLDDLLEKIMDSAIEVAGAERGFLLLYQKVAEGRRIDEKDKGNLVVMVARNADKKSLSTEAFQASRTVIDKVEQTHHPSVVTDATADEQLRTQASVVKYNLRSILCAPIMAKKKELLGIIYLDNRLISGLFARRDLDLLNTLASQAGISIENAILIENEKEMARKVSDAKARARYADILEKKNKELEIAYQEKDKAYEELKSTQAKLIQSEKMAAIGQLGAGAAHELNNPIGGILGYAQFLLQKLKKPAFDTKDIEKFKDYVGYIERESERCKTIIENLLGFSRKPSAGLEPIDIKEVVERTLLLARNQLKTKNIKLSTEYASGLPLVSGNANQLQEVFINIVINAQHAMPDGGSLRIRTGVGDNGSKVQVEFSDTGCGIPPEDLKHIFEAFFTTKKVWKSVGLGLSISYQIIKEHKGDIQVESKVGKGTTFRVILPKAT
ncbi:MAG: tetratricopeptide repeat protein, partial [Candidatus Omnitrophota bacterium]